MPSSSRLSGLHKIGPLDRLEDVARITGLSVESLESLKFASAPMMETADHLVENCIATMNIGIGIATNMIVDGFDCLIPMATEESSVVAAVCNGAKACRSTGGVTTESTPPLTIAQVQFCDLDDPLRAKDIIFSRLADIKALCDDVDPPLVALGGGLKEIEPRLIPDLPGQLILHLIVDTRDAMGANAVNSMAEALAPKIAEWIGGRPALRILSNLADRRRTIATALWKPEEIGGEILRDAICEASLFAMHDPYRAATHNKGIMNGISAVALATGNDTRAIEAGAHAFAARSGQYRALSRYHVNQDGHLEGRLELPLSVGIVGGATKAHPTAQAMLKILDVTSGERLASIMAAVGLVQNFSALRALAGEGIQKGHMALHARNVAIAAGARGEEIERIATAMVDARTIRTDVAEKMLNESTHS